MLAVDAVRIPDVGNLLRGEVRRVVVAGTVDRAGVVEVTLEYAANLVRIRSVEGGSGFAFTCPQAIISSNTFVGTTGTMVVRCDSTLAGQDGNLFVLEIEALHGVGGAGVILPTLFRRDYVEVPGAVLESGTVRIEGDADIVFTTAEGFTGNYPNPFSTQSRFVFTMNQAGRVHLQVRSLQGRSVLDLGSVDATAGENSYELQINVNDLSQGAYVMQMITDRGSYLQPFVVLD